MKRIKLGCLTLMSRTDREESSTRRALSAHLGIVKRMLSVSVSLTDWI
jgi:hypothetical protein